MEEINLIKHINYELYFLIYDYSSDFDIFIKKEINNYSDGYINFNNLKYSYELLYDRVNLSDVYYLDITPHNKYTEIVFSLNKKGIVRYHKLEKLKNIK